MVEDREGLEFRKDIVLVGPNDTADFSFGIQGPLIRTPIGFTQLNCYPTMNWTPEPDEILDVLNVNQDSSLETTRINKTTLADSFSQLNVDITGLPEQKMPVICALRIEGYPIEFTSEMIHDIVDGFEGEKIGGLEKKYISFANSWTRSDTGEEVYLFIPANINLLRRMLFSFSNKPKSLPSDS